MDRSTALRLTEAALETISDRQSLDLMEFKAIPKHGGLNVRMTIPGEGKNIDRKQLGHVNLLKGDEVGFVHLDKDPGSYPEDPTIEDEDDWGDDNLPPKGYLAVSTIFVAKEFRGGLGVALYQRLIEVVKSKGFKGLASNPDDRNIVSDRVWKHLRPRSRYGWDLVN